MPVPTIPRNVRVAPSAGGVEPLLQLSNFTYLGAFRLPSGPCAGDGCSVNYGGEALSFDPSGDGGKGSLWVTGFGGGPMTVGEFSLETVLTKLNPTHTSLTQLPFTTKIQGWAHPLTAGDAGKISPGANVKLGGVKKRADGKLLVNVYTYFGQASTHTSAFLGSANLSAPLTHGGPWEIKGGPQVTCGDGCREGFTCGPFEPIPQRYQAALGGDTLVGGGCYPIISRTSHGPSVTAFRAADVGVLSPVPGRRLVGYPGGHPTLGNWDSTVDGTKQWVGGCEAFARSAVIPAGFRTVAFFGTLGTSDFFGYGPPVGQFDAQGGVYYPTSDIYASGTNASTSADGLTVTVPGANLSGVTIGGDPKGQGIWLKNQITPSVLVWGRKYTAAPMIVAKGDSGLATAWVKVSQAFPPNLTGQAYAIGERCVYDPASRGGYLPNPVTGHSPFSYPYKFVAWLYDVDDLAAVAAGSKQYWEPVPYAVVELPQVIKYPSSPAGIEKKSFGGATSDPGRRLVFLIQQWVGANFDVVVTVWRVE